MLLVKNFKTVKTFEFKMILAGRYLGISFENSRYWCRRIGDIANRLNLAYVLHTDVNPETIKLKPYSGHNERVISDHWFW